MNQVKVILHARSGPPKFSPLPSPIKTGPILERPIDMIRIDEHNSFPYPRMFGESKQDHCLKTAPIVCLLQTSRYIFL